MKCFWVSKKFMNWYDVGTMENSLPHEFVNIESLFCGRGNSSLSPPSSILNLPANSVIQIDNNKTTKINQMKKERKTIKPLASMKTSINFKMYRLYPLENNHQRILSLP